MSSLLESFTLTVGIGIAKGALKVWLGDSEIFMETGSSILDLLNKKTEDRLAIRKANREFEEISEKVASHLMPLFEESADNLNEEEQRRVVSLVGRTLDEVPLEPALMLSQDLNPELLAAHLKKNFSEELHHLSEFEQDFYNQLLAESTQYIIDISSDLPTFNERTFAEILKRDRILISKVDRILEEISRISINTNNKDAYSKFENDYRRTVTRNLDEITLFGTDLSDSNKRYRLSVAYISLHVQSGLNKELKGEFLDDELNKEIQNVEEVLCKSKRLLITGVAGSGKTTLLHWIAVKTGGRSFEGDLNSWSNKIPFYIRLREFTDRELPQPQDFPSLIAKSISKKMPDNWVHDILESGNGILLVDGLDEVSEENRESVRVWVREILGAFPDNVCVLTTRPYAVKDGWLNRLDFHEAELQDMSTSDINAFIHHWHDAIKSDLEDSYHDDLQECENNILKVISEVRPIRELATNPLLCAMLCALNRERNQQIPTDRIELYEACYDLLIQRRDLERKVDLKDYPDLTHRQKQVLLEGLAYRLIKNGYSEISSEKAEEWFNNKLKTIQNLDPKANGKNIRKLFIERSALLRQPTSTSVDFAHKTFQEFLAAKAILAEDDFGVLIQNAKNDQWREVIILAAGLARSKEREDLVKEIIQQGDFDEKNRHKLHFLAIGCLDTIVEMTKSLRSLITSKLKKLVPPVNITEAKALSKLGDLVVPYLKYDMRYGVKRTASSVRALSLIDTDSATKVLKGYFVDTRQTVWQELIKTKHRFDIEEFYSLMNGSYQSYCFLINETKIETNEELKSFVSVFSYAARMPDLSIRVTDLEVISSLSNLTHLFCRYHLSKWQFVLKNFEFPNLDHVSFVNAAEIKHIDELCIPRTVTSLSLGNLMNLESLSGIENYSKLVHLGLGENYKITDFTPLKALVDLDSLFFDILARTRNPYLFSTVHDGRIVIHVSMSSSLEISNFLKKGHLSLEDWYRDIYRVKSLEEITIEKSYEPPMHIEWRNE